MPKKKIKKVKEIPSKIKEVPKKKVLLEKKEQDLEEEIEESETEEFADFIEGRQNNVTPISRRVSTIVDSPITNQPTGNPISEEEQKPQKLYGETQGGGRTYSEYNLGGTVANEVKIEDANIFIKNQQTLVRENHIPFSQTQNNQRRKMIMTENLNEIQRPVEDKRYVSAEEKDEMHVKRKRNWK